MENIITKNGSLIHNKYARSVIYPKQYLWRKGSVYLGIRFHGSSTNKYSSIITANGNSLHLWNKRRINAYLQMHMRTYDISACSISKKLLVNIRNTDIDRERVYHITVFPFR